MIKIILTSAFQKGKIPLLFFIFLASSIYAQNRTVTGTVTDASSGQGLPGVTVSVKNTSKATYTDSEGRYALVLSSEEKILTFSFMGFQTIEEVLGNRTEVNISLNPDDRLLEEVVVTALGVKREERSLGYATQKLGGETLNTVKGANVATSMTGKVAGLWVRNSTEFNEAPTMLLRGETPLLVIDGVPYGNMNLSNIPQDDIESIDVLKGPTAAALYGSRGGGGAVIVTTKKGAKGKGLEVTFNSNNMMNAGFLMLPEVQTGYSAGLGGVYSPTDYVWGAKLDEGVMANQWNPISKQMEVRELTSAGKNNFRDFLQTGFVSNNNLSLAQSGENGSFRMSLNHILDKGQYPNLKANAINFNLSGEMRLSDKLNITGAMGLNRKQAPQTFGAGYGDQGYIYNILVWMGPEYDLSQYKNNYWLVPNERQNWHYTAWYDNPYIMAYEKLRGIEQHKINTNFSINYKLFPGAKLLVRPGFDLYQNQDERRNPPNILSNRGWDAAGMYSLGKSTGWSFNGDAILMYDKKIGKFGLDLLGGGTIYTYVDHNLNSSTRGGITIPGWYSLNNSVERANVSANQNRKQVNSVFGKASFSYLNSAFLDVTGRNDWSSTMPRYSRSYFYPSVAGSLVLSEFIEMPKAIDFLKLRGSWTVAKSDLGVYATNQTYSTTLGDWLPFNSAAYPTTIRDGVVNAQTRRTWETGFSAYFLKKRFKLDAAYFNRYLYNVQVSAPISGSSGFTSTLINTLQSTVRKGLELTLEASAVKKENFSWDIIGNWSNYQTFLKELDPVYSADNAWTTEGHRTDVVTLRPYLRDPAGNLIHGTNGLPIRSNYNYVAGYENPKFVWGIANSFKYNNFTASLSFDGRVGGLMYNYTSYKMFDTGSHPDTDNQYRYDEVVNGNRSYVGQGVKIIGGTVTYDNYGNITSDTREYAQNDTKVSYQSYARNYGDGTLGYVDATFFKLREIALGYRLPATAAKYVGAKSASVSITGQNVWMWTKEFRFADPDKASDSDLTSPSMRYLGLNLQLTF
jgi:TonB-linked SusC/RagA family outer membrane protein